jgi:two-component system KDP operon response regulator KdpE
VTDVKDSVLVVEDEPQLRRFIRAALDANGYRVLEASRASEVVALITSHNPALVLLDLGLPDGDGIDLTRALREWTTVPIVVLSARGREEDKVAALDAGADDYLTKPFGMNELLARMRVALRRRPSADEPAVERAYTFGDLVIDIVRREVRLGEDELHLTPIEYKLLLLLARNAGRVLTHQQILKDVWGPAYATRTHYVRVHMAELRKKIERDPARPKLIVTEPGVGYRLREAR